MFNYQPSVDGEAVFTLSGDADQDGKIGIIDVVTLVNHLMRGGPRPVLEEADVDCTGDLATADVLTLAWYLFAKGKAPCEICVGVRPQ